jgi:aspartate-semialdehyde dehydrogenase
LAKSSEKIETLTRIGLLGSETLLGRELQEVLSVRQKGVRITSFASSGDGSFGEQEGEAVFLEPLNADAVRGSKAIVVAGSAEGASKAYELAKAAGRRPKIIDCTGHLEHHPEARIIAPLLGEVSAKADWLLVPAHPASSAVALVLRRLVRYQPVIRSVVNVFEPASERGKAALAELHQQTASLLAFKLLPKKIFDAQLSFNLLAQYGEDAAVPLASIEQRIERHIATTFAKDKDTVPPMPSLRLIQAPVFHGYGISLWVEFASNITSAAVAEALASAQIEVRGPSEEAPDGVGATGQSGLIAGDIRVDPNNPRAAWLWAVCDNLRLTADATSDLLMADASK